MRRFSEFTLNYVLDFDELRDIRSDWTHFYNEAYHSEKFREQYDFNSLDSGELRKRAITSMEAAGNYRPHKPITDTIVRVNMFFNLLRFGLLALALVLSSALFGIFDMLLMVTTQIQSIIISTIPLDIIVGVMIYIYVLQADDAFVQEFNRKLRFDAAHISRAERRSELLFGYYLWNNGLCNPKKAPALLVLYIIRMISEWLYQRIMGSTKNQLHLFIDNRNFRRAFKIVYKEESMKGLSGRDHR